MDATFGYFSGMRETLTVLGASVRAAVASARAAGWPTFAADLFADLDLQRMSPVEQIRNYPYDLIAAARRAPPGPWLYTGALENHPQVVAAISQFKPLLGNDHEVLRRVRDPFQVADVFRAAGISVPDVLAPQHAPPHEGTWLRKPIRSAAGAGISIHHVADTSPRLGNVDPLRDSIARRPLAAMHDAYLQRFVPGTSVAAVFASGQGRAHLLGVTRQLVGESWTAARPFQYAGSIGPIDLPETQRQAVLCVGETLAREFHLVGLFGVDGIFCDDVFWPVEINPRYTASAEVLERAIGVSPIELHIRAGQGQDVSTLLADLGRSRRPVRCEGKAIVFATTSCIAGEPFCQQVLRLNQSNDALPQIADIPSKSTRFSPGQPVATVFADGQNEADVSRLLQRRTHDLRCALDEVR